MALASRSSSILRSSLNRLYGPLLQQHHHQQPSFAPALFAFARFLSSGASSKLFVGGCTSERKQPLWVSHENPKQKLKLPWGLSWGTDENTLREAFASFGEVIEAKVVMDRETGRSKGFGFVSFTSPAEAESAMQSMDGRNLGGRTLRVNFAIEKPPSQRNFGGFGGAGGAGGNFDFGSSRGDSSFNSGTPNSDFGSSSFGKDSFGQDSFRKDSFGSGSFGKDSFGSDSFGKDSFSNDSFGENSFGNDSFGNDSLGSDSFGKDSFGSGSSGNDSFGSSSSGTFGKDSIGSSSSVQNSFGSDSSGKDSFGSSSRSTMGKGSFGRDSFGNETYDDDDDDYSFDNDNFGKR